MALTKQEKWALFGGGLALSVFIFVVVRRAKNKVLIKKINDILDRKVREEGSPSGQVILTQQQINALPIGSFPLKVGDKNRKVYDLQINLNRNYGTQISADGKFGTETYKILCDKYFNYGCTVVGMANIYPRTISSADFDAIAKYKN
jgi:hypothetical protein